MILVTGATGRTGQHVVDHLTAHNQRVRVLTRAPANVPDCWAEVEVAVGDLNDSDALARAMRDVRAVFVLSPMDPMLDEMEQNVFDTAVASGVEHIVKMSTTKPEPESPIPWWRAHWRAENALRNAGAQWTILRPNGISFFLLEHAQAVRERGLFRTAAGVGRMALIDADDIGAVAARVFESPAVYDNRVLNLTGPVAVSYDDVADVLTSLTGHTVSHLDISPNEAKCSMLQAGLAQWQVDGIVANWQMTRDGSGGFDRVTDAVESIVGRRPLDLEKFLGAHRDAFTPAR